jgi:hypothetical protein
MNTASHWQLNVSHKSYNTICNTIQFTK